MTYIPRTYDAKGEFTDTYTPPQGGWVCFHCGQRFYHQGPARRHFGMLPDETPLCLRKIDIDEARELTGTITDEISHSCSNDMDYSYTYRGTLLFNANKIICSFLETKRNK